MARSLSKVRLKDQLKWWADFLRMKDWTITLKTEFVEQWPRAEAWNQPAKYAHEAVIWIDPRAKDKERALVHELIHIKHSPIIREDVESLLDEPVVWHISDALVTLKRKAYGEEEPSA